jgi:hypothetical protein
MQAQKLLKRNDVNSCFGSDNGPVVIRGAVCATHKIRSAAPVFHSQISSNRILSQKKIEEKSGVPAGLRPWAVGLAGYYGLILGGRGAVSPSGSSSFARSWCAKKGMGGIACRHARAGKATGACWSVRRAARGVAGLLACATWPLARLPVARCAARGPAVWRRVPCNGIPGCRSAAGTRSTRPWTAGAGGPAGWTRAAPG